MKFWRVEWYAAVADSGPTKEDFEVTLVGFFIARDFTLTWVPIIRSADSEWIAIVKHLNTDKRFLESLSV